MVDPALIRALDVGQAAYIYRGGVTYVQVKRLVAGPAALSGAGRARTAAPRRRTAGPVSPHQPVPSVPLRPGPHAERGCPTSARCWTRRSARSPPRDRPVRPDPFGRWSLPPRRI